MGEDSELADPQKKFAPIYISYCFLDYALTF